MLNILIIEDDPNQVKNLITILSRNFSTIRVFSISFDGKSALEIIQNNEIDIILLDLKLSKMCGIDIVNFIECKNLYRYKNSIIIFTGEVSLLRQILHSQYLFSYCLKGNGYNALLKSFRNLIKEKMENKCHTLLSVKIDHELNFLNFNFSHCGTKYLKETIMEVYKIRDDFSGNLEKNNEIYISTRWNFYWC